MFKKLHIKLTVYMGVVLVIFMLFIATGIYNFTKFVFEDGTRKLMQSEAIRIYTYNDTFLSDEAIFEEGNIINSFESNDKKRYFEIKRVAHSHFICSSCSKIECIHKEIEMKLDNHQIDTIIIKGLCCDCLNN